MEEKEDLENKKSPIRLIMGVFLVLIIVVWMFAHYAVEYDPYPRNIPGMEIIDIKNAASIQGSIYDKVIIDDDVKRIADKIAVQSCPSGATKCQAKAVYLWVRDNFDYVKDPSQIEYIKTAKQSMINGGGDCDDASVLLATLLNSIGIKTKFKFIPRHVYVEALIDDKWIELDATCRNCKFGTINSITN